MCERVHKSVCESARERDCESACVRVHKSVCESACESA